VAAADDGPPRGRRRRRVLAASTVLLAAAIVVAVVLATRGGAHQKLGTHRAGAFSATVQRRNLVTSENETGAISYANSATVANRLQGTLTWVPAVGRVILPGRKLFDVDNFPVILMVGTTPAYRTLEASDTPGPDIQQLNENLIKLGFDVDDIVDDDEWQPATTAGVDAFQEANDEPETGSLTLGTVVFLKGAQRVAGLQGGATSVSDEGGEGRAEFVGYTTTATATTTTTTTATTTQTTPPPPPRPDPEVSRLGSQVRQLQRANQRLQRAVSAARAQARRARQSQPGDSVPASGGDSPVMTTTSSTLVVTVDVPAGQQGVTHVGARVPVVMPSGAKVHGHVTGIGQSTAGNVPITIHLDRQENGRNLDQAKVSVTFVQRTARHVLSVPITALLARPGGRFAVQRAKPPHRLIDVRLGTFATGFVQVSGKGLHAGLKITDAQG
jgi:peptidoglycan hydrolase-like protein with peptidoglycan-binding domain